MNRVLSLTTQFTREYDSSSTSNEPPAYTLLQCECNVPEHRQRRHTFIGRNYCRHRCLLHSGFHCHLSKYMASTRRRSLYVSEIRAHAGARTTATFSIVVQFKVTHRVTATVYREWPCCDIPGVGNFGDTRGNDMGSRGTHRGARGNRRA